MTDCLVWRVHVKKVGLLDVETFVCWERGGYNCGKGLVSYRCLQVQWCRFMYIFNYAAHQSLFNFFYHDKEGLM